MPSNVQSLIEAGYAHSSANDPGKLGVDLELINVLNRAYQSRYALWALKTGDASIALTTLTFAGVPASVALPVDIIDIARIETTTGGKVNLVPSTEKDRAYHLSPSVLRQGLSLVTRGQPSDPVAGTTITLYYDDSPVPLTTLAQTLDPRYPARFEALLILRVALYLDSKDEGRSKDETAKLQAILDFYEKKFDEEVGMDDSATQAGSQPRDAS